MGWGSAIFLAGNANRNADQVAGEVARQGRKSRDQINKHREQDRKLAELEKETQRRASMETETPQERILREEEERLQRRARVEILSETREGRQQLELELLEAVNQRMKDPEIGRAIKKTPLREKKAAMKALYEDTRRELEMA